MSGRCGAFQQTWYQKVTAKDRFFSTYFVTFWLMTKGGGNKQKITKCDMGQGAQKFDLFSDILF